MPFLAFKVLHVLAAIVAVGANVSYSFWLGEAGRDRERLRFTIQGVRRLDRRLANPGYVVVLLSGLGMVATGAYRFGAPGTGWLSLALGLYIATAILGITIFAPAIRRQLAEAERDPTSAAYAAAASRTRALGLVTTAIVILIVVLMIAKPF